MLNIAERGGRKTVWNEMEARLSKIKEGIEEHPV
jgi:hypothetical protein